MTDEVKGRDGETGPGRGERGRKVWSKGRERNKYASQLVRLA
jgi:hypothetical protein